MARPKKTNSDELVAMVDSYFTTEAACNPFKLKCSLLEEYATKLGKEVKAYDFRRDEKVRNRINELKRLAQNENGIGMQLGNPYKSLDIARIMKARRDPDELRTVLGELDAYWCHIYENTLQIRQEAEKHTKEKQSMETKYNLMSQEVATLQKKNDELRAENRKIVIENRYLRKMLRTYLYPALANEILAEENQLKNVDTSVTPQAKNSLIDGQLPSPLSSALSSDRELISHEEKLLEEMWNSVTEDTL